MAKKVRKGLASVWIILAIIIVVALLILFFMNVRTKNVTPPGSGDLFAIQTFLADCVDEHVTEVVDIMLPQGGFVEPKNPVKFNGTYIEYMCETVQFFEPCVQQHPMILREMEAEIKNYIFNDLDFCFNEMRLEYGKRNWEIEYFSDLDFDVDLDPGKVVLKISRDLAIDSGIERRTLSEFDVEVSSPAYDLTKVAIDIAAQIGDPDLCYFEHRGYSIVYPRFKIDLYDQMPDSTKIYTINDVYTGKRMRIAVRSCALQRGL